MKDVQNREVPMAEKKGSLYLGMGDPGLGPDSAITMEPQ